MLKRARIWTAKTVEFWEDFFRSLEMDIDFGLFHGEPRAIAWAFERNGRFLWACLVCRFRGHDLWAEARFLDCGGETIHCRRCGWQETVFHG